MVLFNTISDNKIFRTLIYILVIFIILFSLFNLIISFIEFFRVLLGSDSVIRDYHFGSDSMIEKGGWGYKSKENYLLAGLLYSVLFIIFILAAVLLLIKKQIIYLGITGVIGMYCLISLFSSLF